MWPFKTKKEIEQAQLDIRLEKECSALQKKFENEINGLCLNANQVFIFRGFGIRENKDGKKKIFIFYTLSTTPDGYTAKMEYDYWELACGVNSIKEFRKNFVIMKDQLVNLGAKMELI